jgi:hypothetical protein
MENEIDYKKKYQDRNKYINDYMKNKYDRIALLLPKGYKDIINDVLQAQGYKSANEYIKHLIDKDINPDTDQEQSAGFDTGFFM